MPFDRPLTRPFTLNSAKSGYTGVLCGECEASFFKETVTGTCKECTDQDPPVWVVWLIVIGVCILLAYPVWLIYRWAKEKGFVGGGGDDGDKKIKDNLITVFYVRK